MRSLIIGGSGLIGRALLAREDDAIVTSRTATVCGLPSHTRQVRWDPMRETLSREALEGVDAVFNLAGEPVASGRWTTERKRRIRESRVIGTKNLVEGIRRLDRRPPVLVSASAVGYYGDCGDRELTESSEAGDDFLADVCAQWEQSSHEAESLGVRVVCVRIGIVLAPGGGALARMLGPFKLGLGGRIGSGRQWMPWVHIEDVVGVLQHASGNVSVSGPMNAVAPNPVTNSEFTRTLGRALHRPTLFPVPNAVLRLAFGEMGGMLTASQRVAPRSAQLSGYAFRYTELGSALDAVLSALA